MLCIVKWLNKSPTVESSAWPVNSTPTLAGGSLATGVTAGDAGGNKGVECVKGEDSVIPTDVQGPAALPPPPVIFDQRSSTAAADEKPPGDRAVGVLYGVPVVGEAAAVEAAVVMGAAVVIRAGVVVAVEALVTVLMIGKRLLPVVLRALEVATSFEIRVTVSEVGDDSALSELLQYPLFLRSDLPNISALPVDLNLSRRSLTVPADRAEDTS